MNGFLLLIPFILIRYGLLSILNKEGLKRAAFFAPLIGREKSAYWFYAGLAIYGLGILLCLASVSNFAEPANSISLLLNDGTLFCGNVAMNGLPSLHKIAIWAGG